MNPKNKGAELSFKDQYKNAKDVIPAKLIEVLEKAMIAEEITPKRVSIRGGTDGVTLSFNGLPTADIFAGMYNLHGPMEYADLDVMEASLRTLFSTASLWSEQPKPTRSFSPRPKRGFFSFYFWSYLFFRSFGPCAFLLGFIQ